MKLVQEVEVHNELGEGVIWDARRQAVWWTDIQRRRLHRYFPETGRRELWSTPERLACFATIADSDDLIAGFESGFARFDLRTGSCDWIAKVESDNPATRLNDGRADRQGRFWAGSMVEAEEAEPAGSLYRIDGSFNCAATLRGLAISNGLCWSPDSSILYHADTPNARIDAYPFDAETGELGERSTFAETEKGCWPDGSTVDEEGYVWNAQWGGSQVVRYAPSGAVDRVLPVPVTQPSCVAFGGADLNLLVVTSAREDMTADQLRREPRAGNLFVFETDCRGIPDPEFRPSRSASVTDCAG